MSDPRYRVERRMDVAQEVVLAAIARAIPDARLPVPAPKRVRGVTVRVRGERFRIQPDHGLSEGDATTLVGMVRAVEGGGCEVRASVLDSPGAGTWVFGLLGAGAVAGFVASGMAWWLVGFAAVVGIPVALRRASGAINHDEAAFLRDWLNAVLDQVQAAHPASASGATHPAPSRI